MKQYKQNYSQIVINTKSLISWDWFYIFEQVANEQTAKDFLRLRAIDPNIRKIDVFKWVFSEAGKNGLDYPDLINHLTNCAINCIPYPWQQVN